MPKEKNNQTNNSSHTSKPYNVQNSFVKQVSTRVSSLFPRISSWLAPQDEDDGASSSPRVPPEEEYEDAIEQPPAKQRRVELNQPRTGADRSYAGAYASFEEQSDIVDGTIAGPSGLQQRPCLASSTPAPFLPTLELNLKRREEPLINGDDQSVHSDSSVSTSGCSSLIPQGKSQVDNRKYLSTSQWTTHGSEKNTLRVLSRSKQLPDASLSPRLNSSRSGRPSFDPSVFSNPLSPSGLSNCSDRVSLSPFYPGQTQYGGASAYRKPRSLFLPNTTAQPLRQSIQVKPLNSMDLSDLNSCTSRRILDVLDTLSSPVLDAKRIPVASSPALASRKRSAPYSSSPAPRKGGPPTQDLTITTVPDLLMLQRRAKLQDSMEAARLIAASPSRSSLSTVEKEYKMRLDSSQVKPSGKMTSKMKDLEEEMTEEVNLPNIALPISTLPKFDFLATKPPRRKYAFSTPTDLDSREFLAIDPKGSNNFKHGRHDSSHSSTAVGHGSSNFSTQNKMSVPDFIPNCSSSVDVLKIANPDQSKNNGQNSNLGSGSTHLKTGSVMNVLSKTDSSSMSSSESLVNNKASPGFSFGSSALSGTPTNVPVSQPFGFGNQFKKAAGCWECAACMVNNKADATSCVACTTPKPGANPVKPPVSSFASLPKPSGDTWECATCLVRNKPGADFCVCCETKKDKSVGSVGSKPAPAQGFGDRFKKPEGSWVCLDCMLTNKDPAVKCVACEAVKPAPASGFGDMFKKPEGSWVCTDCMLTNKDPAVKCVACEAVKPGTEPKSTQPASTIKYNFSIPPEAASFKFGIDKAVDAGGKKSEPSLNAGFPFGSSTTTTPEAAQPFVFGNTAKPDASIGTKGFTFGIPPKSTAASTVSSSATVNTFSPTTAAPNASILFPPVSSNGPTGFSTSEPDRKRKVAESPAMKFVNPFATSIAQTVNPVKPGDAAKNTFDFGAPSTTATTPTVNFNGLRKEEFPLSAAPIVTATTSSSTLNTSTAPSGIFSFGASKTASTSNSFPTNSAMVGAQAPAVTTNKPTFLFGAASSNQTDEPSAKKPTVTFGSVATTKESGGFGSLTSSAPNFSGPTNIALSGFGNASGKTTGPSFGDAASKSTLSGFHVAATPTFGAFSTGNATKSESTATNASPFVFGGSNNNQAPKPQPLFSTPNAVSQDSVQFGNVAPAPKPAVFSFGASSAEQTSAPCGLFGFPAVPQKPSGGFNFGSANITSGQPMSGFGQASSNPPAMFGGPAQPAFGGNGPAVFGAASQPTSSGGFNFTATTASTGFNFGQSQPSAPNAFNPNTRPSFNFTGGDVPQFSAAGPGNVIAPVPRNRVIKKAVRRGLK